MCFFYNIKYGLKKIEGLVDEEGKPYELKFTENKDALTDECVDELFATDLEDKFIWIGRGLTGKLQDKIINPVTNEPEEGVEIVINKKKKVDEQKK